MRAVSRGLVLVAIAALELMAFGCARRGPPSGGPPDITPPRVTGTSPDSGAAHVPLDAHVSVTFSEGMEPRTTGDAVAMAPPVEIKQRRWSGKTLVLELAHPLAANHMYTLFIGTGARDRHGNTIQNAVAVPFTTSDSFPSGVIEGQIEAMGFPAPGTYLWVYAHGHVPDSTARDFDALGVADADGHFRVTGLAVPDTYRVWGFADLNRNRSYEPQTDVLAPADTDIVLGRESMRITSLKLRMTNPRAPGHVRGTVIDSTRDTLGVVRVIAFSAVDTSQRVVVDADDQLHFEMTLMAGTWLLKAWRDDDRNHAWNVNVEPSSPVERIEVTPAADIKDVRLRMRALLGGP